MDILEQTAKSFDKLTETNYIFVLGKNKITTVISVTAKKEDFTHTIGLDHLRDIWQVSSHKSKDKKKFYDDIIKGIFTYDYIKNNANNLFDSIPSTFNSLTQTEYTIDERIKKIADISALMDTAYNGKVYKWEKKNCQVITPKGVKRNMRIEADYLIVIPSKDNAKENYYLFAYQDDNRSKKDDITHLSIFSAFADCVDVTKGQDKPYIILKETKENEKNKQKEILYIHPSYDENFSQSRHNSPHDNNVVNVKFESGIPKNISITDSGEIAAKHDMLPFKNLFNRIKQALSNLFKAQNKSNDNIPVPEQQVQTENFPDDKNNEPEPPVSKEMSELTSARQAFNEKKINFDEYKQYIMKYMRSLHGKEQWEAAVDLHSKQIDEVPPHMRNLAVFEYNIIKRNFDNNYAPKPRQTFDEIKRAAHEKYIELQNEKKTAEQSSEHTENDSHWHSSR